MQILLPASARFKVREAETRVVGLAVGNVVLVTQIQAVVAVVEIAVAATVVETGRSCFDNDCAGSRSTFVSRIRSLSTG